MSHFGRSGPPDIQDTYSLLVLNITFRTTADELLPLFNRYGKVEDIFIPRDRRTGESRGFAFVRYKHYDEAVKAIERLDGKTIDGRDIQVQYAKYGRNHDVLKSRGKMTAEASRYRSRSPVRRSRDDYGSRRRRSPSPRDRHPRDRYNRRDDDDRPRARSRSRSRGLSRSPAPRSRDPSPPPRSRGRRSVSPAPRSRDRSPPPRSRGRRSVSPRDRSLSRERRRDRSESPAVRRKRSASPVARRARSESGSPPPRKRSASPSRSRSRSKSRSKSRSRSRSRSRSPAKKDSPPPRSPDAKEAEAKGKGSPARSDEEMVKDGAKEAQSGSPQKDSKAGDDREKESLQPESGPAATDEED